MKLLERVQRDVPKICRRGATLDTRDAERLPPRASVETPERLRRRERREERGEAPPNIPADGGQDLAPELLPSTSNIISESNVISAV